MCQGAGSVLELIHQLFCEQVQPEDDDRGDCEQDDNGEAHEVGLPPVAVVPDTVAPERVVAQERLLSTFAHAIRAKLVARLIQAGAVLDVAHNPVDAAGGLDQAEEHDGQGSPNEHHPLLDGSDQRLLKTKSHRSSPGRGPYFL